MIEKKKILALEVWCYKIIQKLVVLNIQLMIQVFQKAKEIRSILKILKSKKAKIIGH